MRAVAGNRGFSYPPPPAKDQEYAEDITGDKRASAKGLATFAYTHTHAHTYTLRERKREREREYIEEGGKGSAWRERLGCVANHLNCAWGVGGPRALAQGSVGLDSLLEGEGGG